MTDVRAPALHDALHAEGSPSRRHPFRLRTRPIDDQLRGERLDGSSASATPAEAAGWLPRGDPLAGLDPIVEAVEALYAQAGATAYRIALGILGGQRQAEDVIAGAFREVVRCAPDGHAVRTSGRLLCRITRREARRLAAGTAPRDPADRAALSQPPFDTLPPDEAEVLFLAAVGGRSLAEVAAERRISRSAAAGLLTSALTIVVARDGDAVVATTR